MQGKLYLLDKLQELETNALIMQNEGSHSTESTHEYSYSY